MIFVLLSVMIIVDGFFRRKEDLYDGRCRRRRQPSQYGTEYSKIRHGLYAAAYGLCFFVFLSLILPSGSQNIF